MNEDFLSARSKLLDNKSHILNVAHVSAYDYAEGTVINEASLRASRIRAYVKSKLNIPHECVAFYIDKSGTYRDRVDVYLVGSPLPWFVNQESAIVNGCLQTIGYESDGVGTEESI